jgi:methionine-rich copper-binding protein CopC
MGGASLASETHRYLHLYPRKMTRRNALRPLPALVAATFALLLGLPSTALAHGDIRDSSPAAGTEVTKPPAEVTLLLAEPVAQGSTVEVTDGCEREVSGDLKLTREVVETPIAGGEPGRWLVRLRSISAVDGHAIKEAFTFKVSGKKDCTPEDGDDVEPDTDISPDTSSRAPIVNPDEEDSSFPVVAFALGTVAVVAVALAVRRPWDKS